MSDDPKTLPSVNLPEPPPEEFPRPFGNYLLLAPLARGGMGEVFLAKHGSVAGLEKHCVVKTLRPHLTDDREYTSRFIDEARIVVQLGHRNICHVFDVGTVGERYYLAMEYIAGKDLRALAGDAHEKTGALMNPGLAVHIVSEVLEALDYAHRQIDHESGMPLQLVHRDVSPQNVMLSWEGEVKLIDFGLAASTLKVEQTSPNVVMGKLAYMAPEQVRGEKVDGRADLFAAAVMMYELLAGERFYDGRSPYEIWGIAAQGGYRPRKWLELNEDMRIILDRGLGSSPSARFNTCLEMREALQGYLHARALRGDAPMLRSLMHNVYASQIDESRRQLATLSKAKVSARFGGSGSGPTSGPQNYIIAEPTQSIARSPSASLENKRLIAAQVGEGTEPTEMNVKPTFASRKTPVAAAGVVLLAIAAVVAVFASRVDDDGDDDPPPVAIHKPVDPVVEKPIEPVVAKPVEPVVEKPVEPVVEKPIEPVVEKPVEPVVEKPTTTKKTKRDGKSSKDAKDSKDTKKTETVVEKPVEAPKPDVLPTYKATIGWPAKTRVLAARCGSQQCIGEVLKHRDNYGSLDADRMKQWFGTVEACWRACGLPMQ